MQIVKDRQTQDILESLRAESGLFAEHTATDDGEIIEAPESLDMVIACLVEEEQGKNWYVGEFGDMKIRQADRLISWVLYDAIEAPLVKAIAQIMSNDEKVA